MRFPLWHYRRHIGSRSYFSLGNYKKVSFSNVATSSVPSKPPTVTPPPNLVEIFVDGKPIQVQAGSVLIEACTKAGAEIPRFCYHERLAIAGNCRVCLVEVEKSPKPVASCAMPVAPGMKVFTNTDMVKKAREGVMEFLLANHPLDCPICDQGGECDLQDQAAVYGSDRGRFGEDIGKRAVEDKNFGPLVKTTMTRCIHCTRCVRFAVDVAGLDDLGTTGRGQEMQIGTYIEKILDSELSANIIDLCPVGALTSKPYAFKARPWELKKTESIDIHDAVGSHIRIDSRGPLVYRVLPRENMDINEAWLADKSRFACDGLRTQRLTSPLIRMEGDSGKPGFVEISWDKALGFIADEAQRTQQRRKQFKALVGATADVESMVALRDLFHRLDSEHLYVDGKFQIPYTGFLDIRTNYIYNTSIAATEKANSILIIDANPRHEAALLNLRIRKAYLNGASIGIFGPQNIKLNYEYEHLGDSPGEFLKLLQSPKKSPFLQDWINASHPLLILGSALFENETHSIIPVIQNFIKKNVPNLVREDWNGYNILQRDASRVGALDLGYSSNTAHIAGEDVGFIYLLNADNIDSADIPEDAFVVYQGHHGDIGASFADLVLPGLAYTEKDATFVNLEGRPQRTKAAVPPPEGTRLDWHIIRAVSEVLGIALPYNADTDIRARMMETAPHLVETGILQNNIPPLSQPSSKHQLSAEKLKSPFSLPIQDYYMTDPISRASPTMAQCSQSFVQSSQEEGH